MEKIKAGMFKGRKRISFPVMFLSALVISTLLTFVLYAVFKDYLEYSARVQAGQCAGMTRDRIISVFEKAESELPEEKDKITYLNSEIAIAADELNKISFDGLIFNGSGNKVNITPCPGVYDVAVTVRPFLGTYEGNIFDDTCLASNKRMFTAELDFGKGCDHNGIYVCPVYMKGVPETEQIYKDYRELADSALEKGNQANVRIDLESFYCDKKTGIFIPHEGKMILECFDSRGSRETKEKDIYLELHDTGFELIRSSEDQHYPDIRMQKIYGTDPEIIEYMEDGYKIEFPESTGVFQELNGGFWNGISSTVVFENRRYDLLIRSVICTDAPVFVMIRRRAVVLFFAVSFLAAFLLCWRKYILNKAECYFEDYRRDMTGHLAHDIKTPLMAISGYAENILETDPDEDKKKKYLDSIMGNVEFTKRLIERTAVLNSMERESGKPDKEKINIEKTLRTLFDKYSLMLNERHIEVSLKGNAIVNANRESTESLLENLVSNAVKYTAENGTLKAEISTGKLVMSNTVPEKINTKDLKRPFVRGDRSRSNTRGTGLGLSIAESAAQLNGFKLKIKCTEKKFISEIVF